jgi:hypothetical protein
VSAAGEEAMEPRGGLWDGVGPGDAERVESLRSRRGRERRLYGAAVLDQKSRLA